MTLEDFRREMESYRRIVDDEAKSLKDPHIALDRLHSRYSNFGADDRSLAEQVLQEWVLSEDANLRFDALTLIDDFKIVSAIASLRTLGGRLTASRAPGAPYELEKIRRMLRDLGSP